MGKKRRRFSAEFKLKVVLEALKERQDLNEIAQKHQLHQNQISTWKSAFLAQAHEPEPDTASRTLFWNENIFFTN